ncbi:hypothetical protein H5410_011718 [Solanum commersonii]|uniref:Uncharacterized protein n=1 Tax=Solanum commersonii TaxID=4109 RepID=A0A9J6AQ69_SOLCO|nr:hypothetical protein H5410_011718 [Solanum commersonii]
MSNQQRPFSWFRLAPFGRQMQPTPPPTPRPTAFRSPAPRPYRPPAPQPRPPAVTSATPIRASFPGIITTPQPAPKSPTPSTAPVSPAKSILSSSPTSPAFLPIASSSFSLKSPETKTPKPTAKTAAPPPPSPATTAPTTSRIVKPWNESPPKLHPETKPLFRLPGKEAAGNSKMNEKSAMDSSTKLPRRLVTLIGENKGAIMLLKPNSTKKSYTTTNVFGGKSQTVGKKEEGNTVEGDQKKKKEDQSDMNSMEMEESTMFINSNVQGVNNSILDESSFTDHNPGFHIFFSTD